MEPPARCRVGRHRPCAPNMRATRQPDKARERAKAILSDIAGGIDVAALRERKRARSWLRSRNLSAGRRTLQRCWPRPGDARSSCHRACSTCASTICATPSPAWPPRVALPCRSSAPCSAIARPRRRRSTPIWQPTLSAPRTTLWGSASWRQCRGDRQRSYRYDHERHRARSIPNGDREAHRTAGKSSQDHPSRPLRLFRSCAVDQTLPGIIRGFGRRPGFCAVQARPRHRMRSPLPVRAPQ